jgi:hypothetical protein
MPKMLEFADKPLDHRPLSIMPDIVFMRLFGFFLGQMMGSVPLAMSSSTKAFCP